MNDYKYIEPLIEENREIIWLRVIKDARHSDNPVQPIDIPNGAITWLWKNAWVGNDSSSICCENNRHGSNFKRYCFEQIPGPIYEPLLITTL